MYKIKNDHGNVIIPNIYNRKYAYVTHIVIFVTSYLI